MAIVMKILFVAPIAHEKLLSEILKENPRYYGIQGQYFMHLMILGLKANGANVEVLSNFIARRYLSTDEVSHTTVEEKGIRYNYVFGNRWRGYWYSLLRMVRFVKSWGEKSKDCPRAIICDGLNFTSVLACCCCKLLFHNKVTVVVTDMPRFLVKGLASQVRAWIQEALIRHMSSFVVLTRFMEADLNRHRRPSLVMEGMVDAQIACCSNRLESREKVFLYTGSIHKIYGIKKLVDSFLMLNASNTVLEIYGDGDYKEELTEIASKHANIIYGGLISREKIVERQKQVYLLINPRPSQYEYTQYSFPSKTMEYMLSGTPVLTTKLPGIPDEYDKYLYYFDEESVPAMADKMAQILSMDYSICLAKAQSAQRFVMEEKNNYIQMKRVMSILN